MNKLNNTIVKLLLLVGVLSSGYHLYTNNIFSFMITLIGILCLTGVLYLDNKDKGGN